MTAYFHHLNYTLANEDTALEMTILPESVDHVAVVGGSGSRVLPLFAKNPKNVTCVDISPEQLLLVELRIETCRQLVHVEFLDFWGYPHPEKTQKNPSPSAIRQRRKILFNKLILSVAVQSYFQKLFTHLDWQRLLYLGRWEQTFQKIAKITRLVTRSQADKLFSFADLDQQIAYLKHEFPRWGWYLGLLLVGNGTYFNTLLYKGHFPQKNISQSYFRYYVKAFDHLLHQGLARENYFLQLVFLGEIKDGRGNPVECHYLTYQAVQAGIKRAKIVYQPGSILDQVQIAEIPIDFLSMSDVPSYFSGETEKNYLQQMRPNIKTGGLVVDRYYLHVPEDLNLEGFESVTETYRQQIEQEKTQMYRVVVLKRT